MTPEQTAKLIELLSKIADALSTPKPYTITGAADWPILLVVSGILAILIGLIGGMIRLMWSDLRLSMRDSKNEWREAVAQAKHDEEKEHDLLWSALRDCQGDCCPPRIGHTPETGRYERRSARSEGASL